jgi:hypothetical protein
MVKFNSIVRVCSFALLIAITVTLVNCSSKTSKTDTHASGAKLWPEKMQLLSKALSDLMPLVSSKKKFSDPQNQPVIEERTETLKSLAHAIKTGPKPNSDPSMQVVSTLMEEDINKEILLD